MLLHVLDALAELPIDRVVVVVGFRAPDVVKAVQADAPSELRIEFVEQIEPLGTGDATAVALTGFESGADLLEGDLVVMPGDTPLVRPATLAALVRIHRATDAAATLLTTVLDRPTGYGRIVRTMSGDVERIVEEAEATDEERDIHEVATSIYCVRHSVLAPTLRRIAPSSSNGEYYLTDAIAVLEQAGYTIATLPAPESVEAAGVNDRAQLSAAEAVVRARINERWMRRGVTMVNPEDTYVDASVELAEEVMLGPGVILEGTTRVDSGAVIGPYCHLVDCAVGSGARVERSVATQAVIGKDAVVGPFAHLEMGTRVASGARVRGVPAETGEER